MKILYSSEFVSVYFDPTIPCIVWKPLDSIPIDEEWRKSFEEGILYIIDYDKQNPGKLGWVNDTEKIQAVGDKNLSWLTQHMNDRVLRLGARKVSFVMPDNELGKNAIRLYINLTILRNDNCLQIAVFETLEEAKGWIGVKDYAITES